MGAANSRGAVLSLVVAGNLFGFLSSRVAPAGIIIRLCTDP